VERGRHHRLRGNEVVGYEGVIALYRAKGCGMEKVLWALERIAWSWTGATPAPQVDFLRLVGRIPNFRQVIAPRAQDLKKKWPGWAAAFLPKFEFENEPVPILKSQLGQVEFRYVSDTELTAEIRIGGGSPRTLGPWGPPNSIVAGFRPLWMVNCVLESVSDCVTDEPELGLFHDELKGDLPWIRAQPERTVTEAPV
jgi:hypothetical protein